MKKQWKNRRKYSRKEGRKGRKEEKTGGRKKGWRKKEDGRMERKLMEKGKRAWKERKKKREGWKCHLTATLSVCSETRSSLVRPSSSGPWPGWLARPTPGTSACGSASPARRSAPGWRRCAAFSSWAASGSGTGVRFGGSRRTERGQLEAAGGRNKIQGREKWICVASDSVGRSFRLRTVKPG